jgi:hypothetical protein
MNIYIFILFILLVQYFEDHYLSFFFQSLHYLYFYELPDSGYPFDISKLFCYIPQVYYKLEWRRGFFFFLKFWKFWQ